jgi:hypothetical protein
VKQINNYEQQKKRKYPQRIINVIEETCTCRVKDFLKGSYLSSETIPEYSPAFPSISTTLANQT